MASRRRHRRSDSRVSFAGLPPASRKLLQEIGGAVAERGGEAFAVGGVVRDLILGRSALDIDVAIVGHLPRIAEELGSRWGGEVRAHGRFTTATVTLPDGVRLDVARARGERYPRPAALPRVLPADLETDLRRRDFTINALAASLAPRRLGRIVDPLGGREDLRARCVRVIHDASFVDDPTRLFRAARFAARLEFAIEPRTARLMNRALRENRAAGLSAARLLRELRLLLEEHPLERAVRVASACRLWRALDPGLHVRAADTRRAGTLERLLDDRQGSGGSTPPRWIVALTLLTRGLTPAARAELRRRLRPARRAAAVFERSPAEARRILERLSRRRRLDPGRIRTACAGASLAAVSLAAVCARRSAVAAALKRYFVEDSRVKLEIDGGDLLRSGIPPGPAIAAGLEAALRARLDGRAEDASAQLRIALRHARSS